MKRATAFEKWLKGYNSYCWCLASGGHVERYMRAAFNAGLRAGKRAKGKGK